MGDDANLYGDGLLGESLAPQFGGALGDRFMIPPFTVLNAREGWWQERKRAWIALGIKSELGRGENIESSEPLPPAEPQPTHQPAAASSQAPEVSVPDGIGADAVPPAVAPPQRPGTRLSSKNP